MDCRKRAARRDWSALSREDPDSDRSVTARQGAIHSADLCVRDFRGSCRISDCIRPEAVSSDQRPRCDGSIVDQHLQRTIIQLPR